MRFFSFFLLVISCIFISAFFDVQAAIFNEFSGRVNMQGTISDTACTIAVDSREQIIDMGVVSVADIVRDGQGRSKKFSIRLAGCVLGIQGKDERKQFNISFDGDSKGDFFTVHGDATGVALQLIDQVGNAVLPGNVLPFVNIPSDDMHLYYTLKLVANDHMLNAGSYFSSIRFRLDYF